MNDPGPVYGSSPHAAWLNKLRRFIQAQQPIAARGWKVNRGPNGWSPAFPETVGGGVTLIAYKFESMGSGYIKCRPWNGTSIDTVRDALTNIAIPHEIGGIITKERIDAVVWTYTNDIANQKRTATSTAGTENQIITPRYLPWTEEATYGVKGSIIYAVPATTFVTDQAGATVGLLDLNIAGRAWAAY